MIRITALFTLFLTLGTSAVAENDALSVFPLEIKRGCRGGSAKSYDECGDQEALFQLALKTANQQGKVLLVSYGAEWCIWCHVFSSYVRGESGVFTHSFADPDGGRPTSATMFETPSPGMEQNAKDLQAFVADTFVLLYLESHYAQGARAAVASTGYDADDIWWIPFVFTVRTDGTFAMALEHERVERRREGVFWYRGYDRKALKEALSDIRDAAQSAN